MSTNLHVKNLIIYKYGYECMAGGHITASNPLTMHHIVRFSTGGATSIENGSNICHLEHSGIEILTDKSHVKAKVIRDYLYDLKYEREKYEELREYLVSVKYMKIEFQAWLQAELMREGMRASRTRDNLLIYRRK